MSTALETSFETFCWTHLGQHPGAVRERLSAWLSEDLGHGDATVRAMGAMTTSAISGALVAKQNCVVAGLPLAAEMLRIIHGEAAAHGALFASEVMVPEGHKAVSGATLLRFSGIAAPLLMAERSCLNLLARLCGIASYTNTVAERVRQCAQAAGRSAPRLLETRKTTPGLKIFEKYATRMGGAHNHRLGLDAGAMLKENHLCVGAAAGHSLQELTGLVRDQLPLLTGLEVEVTNLAEFEQALEAGADVVMLDNFSMADVALAVQRRNALGVKTLLEISGNLDRKPVEDLVATGVDLMSMGALIHQAPWTDLSMRLEPLPS
jgi:nicotinate-nucleotide pyrophosphorylase (carboxylating)